MQLIWTGKPANAVKAAKLLFGKLSGAITIDKSDAHAKSQGQRSKIKAIDVKQRFLLFKGFQVITLIWIHGQLWNSTHSF